VVIACNFFCMLAIGTFILFSSSRSTQNASGKHFQTVEIS
jgi:hypothetical protein